MSESRPEVFRVLVVPAELIDPVNELSANTRRRCERAFVAWQTGTFDLLVLTGGRFLPPHVQTSPAAHLMRDWFLERGLRVRDIVIECRSLDTYGNVRYAMRAIGPRGVLDGSAEITVCTQWQHALRFWWTFWWVFRMPLKLILVDQPEMSWSDTLMEYGLMLYTLFDPRGVGSLARHNRKSRAEATGIPYREDDFRLTSVTG